MIVEVTLKAAHKMMRTESLRRQLCAKRGLRSKQIVSAQYSSLAGSANTLDQAKLVKRMKKFSSNVERNYTISRIKNGKSEASAI
jgi:hypothetical protein